MRTPHFVRLAEIDERRFITACRHGLIHLTWKRTTIRMTRDELWQLAGLLEQASDALPPATKRAGELVITYRQDEDCEFQIGPLVLLLSPAEFQAFVKAAREATHRLDEILESGMWDDEEPEDEPSDFWEQLRRIPFSRN